MFVLSRVFFLFLVIWEYNDGKYIYIYVTQDSLNNANMMIGTMRVTWENDGSIMARPEDNRIILTDRSVV